MWTRFKRLFLIKTRFEASLITYALALGAFERGKAYIAAYPGIGGWLLCLACTGSVFLAGGMIFDMVAIRRARDAER